MIAWIFTGLILLSGAGMVLTYFKGAEDRENQIMAQRYIHQTQLKEHKKELENVVVEAIQKIKVEDKTYIRNFKEIEKETVVYRECEHTDDAFRLLNAALRGDPVPGQPAVQGDVPK